ncbi:MAG: ABC transporter substrate-binding protein [Roseobacter sp.]
MTKRRVFLGGLVASTTAFLSPPLLQADTSSKSVIAIGGAITEIVFALGQGHRLLARDSTSTYPQATQELPDVGYMRQLSAEGVLSYAPSIIIAAEGAGPPEVIEILRAASVTLVDVPDGYDADAIIEKIRIVGAALGVPERAKVLADETRAALETSMTSAVRTQEAQKRVLFILSTQGGRILASGKNTGADSIIQMAGAQNAVQSFQGYKPLSDEAVSAAAPDVVLMMDHNGNHATNDAALFELPALSITPAAQSRSVIRMNGLLLLGFGPRTADAVVSLNRSLYPA